MWHRHSCLCWWGGRISLNHRLQFRPIVPTRIEPLVTVILPVWNRERSVGRAITSVLQQTYRHFEIIVVDDGSTDGTRRAVDAFGADVRVLTQPHRGVYAARNLALRHASGDLIAFIDCDDVWLPP